MSARTSFVVAMFAMLAAPLGGCARLVVIDPDLVAARNSPDWTVQREPGATASPSPVASATPRAASVTSTPAPPQATAPPAASASDADDDDDD